MVGIGLLMLAIVVVELVAALARPALSTRAWFLRLCVLASPLGFIAVLAGWTTTEVGRQPWTVYGLLRTAEFGVAVADRRSTSRSRSLATSSSIWSCFAAGIALMSRIVQARPGRGGRAGATIESGRPQQPVDAPAASRVRRRRMTGPMFDFVPIWTLILGVGVFFYVLLDGFDLGVGILYGFAPDRDARNLVMNSIAPIWDGNETWLVLGGVALLAAFPLAFAIIMPAVYFPILVMLLALIFRGVAFEFRFRDAEHRTFWDHGFCYGSALGAFAQGVVLGAFIQGFEIDGRQFRRQLARLLHPVLAPDRRRAGVRLRAARRGLADPQDRGRAAGLGPPARAASPSPASSSRSRVVSLWTPFLQPDIAARWFSWPNIALLVAGADPDRGRRLSGTGARSTTGPRLAPFIGAVCLFVMSYLGIAISLWPMIVPHNIRSGRRPRSEHAGLPAGRHAVPAAGHPDVHRLVLLGVPRQGAGGHRLPLSSCDVFEQRLQWTVAA